MHSNSICSDAELSWDWSQKKPGTAEHSTDLRVIGWATWLGILSISVTLPARGENNLEHSKMECGTLNELHNCVQSVQFLPAESKPHCESARKQPLECSISEVLGIQVLNVSILRFMCSYRHRDYQVKGQLQCKYSFCSIVMLYHPSLKASQCQWYSEDCL